MAILHLLLQQRAKRGSPLAGGRVLVSAHTNVAVDRVLLGKGRQSAESMASLGLCMHPNARTEPSEALFC